MVEPLTSGVCTIWTNSAIVSGNYNAIADAVNDGTMSAMQLNQACAQATDILYALSGRQYTGVCEKTIRPAARPLAWTVRDWTAYVSSVNGGIGYTNSWGLCMGGFHDSCRNVAEVSLGVAPIRGIVQVKLDGQIVPSDEYRVDDNRLLVRVRPTADAAPSIRWGWPTCQDLELPDSEVGTFSVDVMYGMDPPASAVSAANALASQLALSKIGAPNSLPARLTSITRQGVTMAVMDPMQFLNNGLTGVYEADMFIKASNPQRQRRRPKVYSRDTGYTRSQGN